MNSIVVKHVFNCLVIRSLQNLTLLSVSTSISTCKLQCLPLPSLHLQVSFFSLGFCCLTTGWLETPLCEHLKGLADFSWHVPPSLLLLVLHVLKIAPATADHTSAPQLRVAETNVPGRKHARGKKSTRRRETESL